MSVSRARRFYFEIIFQGPTKALLWIICTYHRIGMKEGLCVDWTWCMFFNAEESIKPFFLLR